MKRRIHVSNLARRGTAFAAVLLTGVGPGTGTAGPATDPLPARVTEAFREWRTDAYDYDPPAPGTYALPSLGPAADGNVLGADGREVALHRLTEGRIVVLSFIYTRCADPKACLLATGVLGELRRLSAMVPGLAERLLLVSLSFDPAHDTPEAMERYGRVASDGAGGAEWLFLTTRSQDELEPLLKAYGQRVDARRKPGPSGPLSHPLRVYLIDGAHRVRNVYSDGLFDPRLVFTDIMTVLAEPPEAADQE